MKQTKPTKAKMNGVPVQLLFTEREHRAISALAAANGESIEQFIGRAIKHVADFESDTVGDNIKETLGL